MSAVSFASGGYVCQAQGGQVTVVCQEDIVGSVVEEELLAGVVTEDCAAPAFDILTLTPPSPVEIGTVVNMPAFLATYNRPPTAAVLTNDDNAEAKNVISTPGSFFSDQSYQRTAPGAVNFTLTADDGGTPDVQVAQLLWQARLFIFWSLLPGPLTEAQVLAGNQLINALDPNALFDVTLNPTNGGAGAYLWTFYDDSFGPAVPLDFEIGNFGNGDVTEVQTGLAITVPGGTRNYRGARSDNLIEAPAGVRFARES